jgi:hypothetical protein
MLVMIAYDGTVALSGKQQLITLCRAIAHRYPRFDIVVFDTDSRTVDIMDAVWPTFFWSV